MKLSIAVLAAFLLTTSAAETPKRLELTLNDIVEVYNVPVEKEPAYKFQWTFPSPRYVRFVVEQGDAEGRSWRMISNPGWFQPTSEVRVLYKLNTNPPWGRGEQWALDVWLKTPGGGVQSNIVLPATIGYDGEHGAFPDRVALFRFKNHQIRFRLEHSEAPWADAEPK